MTKDILVTGSNGGIGREIVKSFIEAGWRVVGVDQAQSSEVEGLAGYVSTDLAEIATDASKMAGFAADVRASCDALSFRALVNNAAVQHVAPLDELQPAQILETLHVNVAAPILLARAFLSDLRANSGVIINIGSVHAQATKPEFTAYATSKAALHGATRALAVDLSPDVRAVTLAPAATRTPLLEAGFKQGMNLRALEAAHPVNRIAEPEEIGRLAVFLAGPDAGFLSGATLYADGGVLSRLHDPV